MHALIDGDVLVYAAGFASDAAAKRVAIQQGATEEEAADAHEPLQFCLHGVGEKINSIRNKVDATKSTIFLSHPVNYREQLYPEYKANRNVLHKPFWYDEIKDYLLNRGAVYSEQGDEADDAMGIAQVESAAKGKSSIICTNDKDLDMIPGLHYNWSKTREENGVYQIDSMEGLLHFYTQLITGDSTDNIPGLFKHSGKKATAPIKAGLLQCYTERDMYQYVLDVYKGDSDFISLTGRLLWIKRQRGVEWEAPK